MSSHEDRALSENRAEEADAKARRAACKRFMAQGAKPRGLTAKIAAALGTSSNCVREYLRPYLALICVALGEFAVT